MKSKGILALAAVLLLGAGSAEARIRVHCLTGYHAKRYTVVVHRHHKRVRVHRYRCVRNPQQQPPPVHYKSAVDPTFTQDPTNPLIVTYTYDADAFAGTTDLAAQGQLPAGVLNFYSATKVDGSQQLECSINVGGAVTSGQCRVVYDQPGAYAVTTQYIPDGVTAVTETDVETIAPYATTTSVQLTSVPCDQCDHSETQALLRVVDQNGNAVSGPVLVKVTPSVGTATYSLLAAGQTCTIDSYSFYQPIQRAYLTSSDCQISASGDTGSTWSISAQFEGTTAWTASESADEVLQ